MPMPTVSPSDTKHVKLGVCKITYDGQDLGYTKDGVEVKVETSTHKVNVDQFGETEINEIIMGRTVSVSTKLAETTLDRLVMIMPGATLVTDSADQTKMRVDVPTGTGTSLLDIAAELVLHPIANDELDKSEDFTVFKAGTPGGLSFAYKLEDERVYDVEFSGYPDIANDNMLFSVGDPSATP